MDPIDKAIDDLKSQKKPNISATARKWSVERSRLSKRWNGKQGSKQAMYEDKRLLSDPQERELIRYIKKLTDLGLPPTATMVRNFAEEIVGKEPNKNWPSDFVKRHKDVIDSAYLNNLDKVRKKADNYGSYFKYFHSLKEKVEKYGILPENTYNMDEKGFLIGVLNKMKRYFTKHAIASGQLKGATQDGNREWVTVIAGICADGTSLPPALIYKALNGNLQDTWVEDVDPELHTAFFTSSPSGWTNDELGYMWLTQIFDRFSKKKARNGRDWRLLLLDGHGSHLNMRFLDWALDHQIMVGIYPPHSTHRLQPLDVALFGPLASCYSTALNNYLHKSMAIQGVTKRAFFNLFWTAWTRAITEKNILSGFAQTGVNPLDPEVILRKLQKPAVLPAIEPSSGSRPSTKDSTDSRIKRADWVMIEGIVKEAVDSKNCKKVIALHNKVDTLRAQNALLTKQVSGLIEALNDEKKRRKRGKTMLEQLRSEDSSGALFHSPNKVARARAIIAEKDRQKDEAAAQKEANKVQKALEKEHATMVKQTKALERQVAIKEKKEKQAQEAMERQAKKEALQADKQLKNNLSESVKKAKNPLRRAIFDQPAIDCVVASPSKKGSIQLPSKASKTRTIVLPVRFQE